jgi:hypothetical protein
VVDKGEIGVDQFATCVCWWIVSELATVMIQPTGVRDPGRAIVIDIVSFIANMLAATTTSAWK